MTFGDVCGYRYGHAESPRSGHNSHGVVTALQPHNSPRQDPSIFAKRVGRGSFDVAGHFSSLNLRSSTHLQRCERFLKRRAGDAFFRDDGGNKAGGSHVESGMRRANVRRDAHAGEMSDFLLRTLFDGDVLSRWNREIEGRKRRGNVKRNLVSPARARRFRTCRFYLRCRHWPRCGPLPRRPRLRLRSSGSARPYCR